MHRFAPAMPPLPCEHDGTMSRLIMFVLAAAACTHDTPKPADPAPVTDPTPVAAPAADPAPCADVASHMVKLGSVTEPHAFAELITRHCKDEQWSVEARRCFLTANSNDDGIGCESKLTKVQLDAFVTDVKAHGATPIVQKPTQ
jgi:hypothetical protein